MEESRGDRWEEVGGRPVSKGRMPNTRNEKGEHNPYLGPKRKSGLVVRKILRKKIIYGAGGSQPNELGKLGGKKDSCG